MRGPRTAAALIVVASSLTSCSDAALREEHTVTVMEEMSGLMREYEIPGMAVAISHEGQDYFIELGVMDPTSERTVTRATLFEVGSISKLLTATVATYAQQNGLFSLTRPIASYSVELSNSELGRLPAFHLATHTVGGFPLQVSESIDNESELVLYLERWEPKGSAGTQRDYSNLSIGLLGVLVANAQDTSFAGLMEEQILPALGMRDSFITVPPTRDEDYAWGTSRDGDRTRVSPGLLADEAYGLKTTSTDLLGFLKKNLDMFASNNALSVAIRNTHKAYFDVGPFQQALIWERYQYPLSACALESGNSSDMILRPAPVTASAAEFSPYALSKTGSTGGFGAYVLAIPEENFAIAILANRYYPNIRRVQAAQRITGLFIDVESTHCRS